MLDDETDQPAAACCSWPWCIRAQGAKASKATALALQRWLAGDADWKNAEESSTFARNCDLSQTHLVKAADAKWISSSHCFQCALNTVHECDDFGDDIHTFPDIRRKWLSAQVSGSVHYPRVRYIVDYPPNTPRLPYHDHPGGEEYIVFTGRFADTNFAQVEAPALVRYPIGTHHAAMTQPFEGRTEILTWWGLMQATSATESAQHVALCPRLLVPRQREASWIDGPRRGWAISKDGLETRIERWAPHAKKARLPTPKAGCDPAGQHLRVCPGACVPETYQGDLPAARVAVGGAARGGCHGGRGVGSIGGGRLDLLCARGLAGPPQPPPMPSPRL